MRMQWKAGYALKKKGPGDFGSGYPPDVRREGSFALLFDEASRSI